jgi:hypothetical protein
MKKIIVLLVFMLLTSCYENTIRIDQHVDTTNELNVFYIETHVSYNNNTWYFTNHTTIDSIDYYREKQMDLANKQKALLEKFKKIKCQG